MMNNQQNDINITLSGYDNYTGKVLFDTPEDDSNKIDKEDKNDKETEQIKFLEIDSFKKSSQ